MAAFVGGPLALLASAVGAAVLLKWWALLLVPVGIVVWLAWYSTSSRGNVGLKSTSWLVGLAAIFYLFDLPITYDRLL